MATAVQPGAGTTTIMATRSTITDEVRAAIRAEVAGWPALTAEQLAVVSRAFSTPGDFEAAPDRKAA